MDLLEGLLPSCQDMCLAPMHLEKLYIFALMWSVGALLELEDRAKMEAFLVEQGTLNLPPVQENETIFEYSVNDDGQWQHWSKKVEEYIYPRDSVPEYASILVPNVDNVRTTFLIDTIAKQSKAVLLIGEQGTAKTVMIKGYTSKYDPEKQLFKSFNFSSASTPTMFQVSNQRIVHKITGHACTCTCTCTCSHVHVHVIYCMLYFVNFFSVQLKVMWTNVLVTHMVLLLDAE